MWLTCGQVLIREVVRLRVEPSADVYTRITREEELVKLLDKIQFVLLSIGTKVPVFRKDTYCFCVLSILILASRHPI
jgi:hypothetical protein